MKESIAEYVAMHAQNNPDKLCIVDEEREMTYAQYWQLVETIAAYFYSLGVRRQDYVIVEAFQSITCLAIELAIHLCGGIFVPLEKNCNCGRIKDIVLETNSKVVITAGDQDVDCLNILYDKIELLPKADKILFVGRLPAGEETAEILFSTGTTGKPKGIELTHYNDIALAENVMYGVEMKKDNIEIIPVPLNHSHGLRRYYGNMMNGSTVILMNGVLNISHFFHVLEKYKVTSIDLVPASLAVILKLSGASLSKYKNQIEYIQLGTAPLPEKDKEILTQTLPETRLYNFYGSTESGCVCILDFNRIRERKNCIGRPTINAEVAFMDDDNQPFSATADTPGRLGFRGPMNMKSYWNDPAETGSVMNNNGYLITNDLGYMDSEGYIILNGRKSDVINVGGNKMAPEELETVVRQFEGIDDCACVGIMDPIKGQVPKLFIQINENFSGEKALAQFVGGRLEGYKIPKDIVRIEKIPRTFNGKIIRKDLQGTQ